MTALTTPNAASKPEKGQSAATLGMKQPSDKLGTPVPDYGMSGSFGQISEGPAAIAMTALYEVMSIYEKLMNMYNKQAQSQITVSGETCRYAAAASIAAAASQADATRMQAYGSFANAGVSAVSAVGTEVATKPGLDEAGQCNMKVQDFQANRDALNDAAEPAVVVGPSASRDQLTQQRINSLKVNGQLGDGDFTAPDTTRLNEAQRTAAMKQARQSATNDAIPHMTEDERATFLEALNTKEDTASRAENNAYTRVSSTQQKWQTRAQFANNAFSGGFGCAQASAQAAQGQHQAAQTIASTTSQMAQGLVSNSEQSVGKFYDKQIEELQQLAQISSNSQVRG